jgi:radical SAM enzyme (TIGR01210 family)
MKSDDSQRKLVPMKPDCEIQISHSKVGDFARDVQQIVFFSREGIKKEPFHRVRHQIVFDNSGKPLRGIIALSTPGCSYARCFGPCSICGHPSSCIWDVGITQERIVELFHTSLGTLRMHRPRTVCVYSSGSFCDDQEINRQVRLKILRALANEDWVENIVFESLPQFLSPETVEEISQYLYGKTVTIGVGLDCSNEVMRSILTLKNIKDVVYEAAAKNCRKAGIIPAAYVVLKPPFLTEGESVWEAAQAIHAAMQMGYLQVSLEPIALQHGTLQSLLWLTKLYYRPSIWTILESILLWRKKYPVEYKYLNLKIGGEVFTPRPYLTYARCKVCNTKALPILRSLGVNFESLSVSKETDECCNQRTPHISQPEIDEIAERVKNTKLNIMKSLESANWQERYRYHACTPF